MNNLDEQDSIIPIEIFLLFFTRLNQPTLVPRCFFYTIDNGRRKENMNGGRKVN